MKIYILTGEEYESSTILGAYSSLDEAKKAQYIYELEQRANKVPDYFSFGVGVTEVELDAPMTYNQTEVRI